MYLYLFSVARNVFPPLPKISHSFLLYLSPCCPARDRFCERSGRRQTKDRNRGIVPRSSRLFIRHYSFLFPVCTKFRRTIFRLASTFDYFFLRYRFLPKMTSSRICCTNIDVRFVDKRSFRDDADIYSPKNRV